MKKEKTKKIVRCRKGEEIKYMMSKNSECIKEAKTK